MSALRGALENSAALFLFLSVLNELFAVFACLFTALTIFKAKFRKNRLIYILIAVGVIATGILRAALDKTIAVTFAVAVLPYVCMAAAAKKRYIAKGLCSVFMISTLNDVLKYVLLTMFTDFSYAEADPRVDFIMELISTAALFAAAAIVFFALARKRDSESRFAQLDLPLIFMVFTAIGLFIVTILLLGINNFGENRTEYIITLLNIPVIGATAAYAARTILKTKLSEENYRQQLNMQVKHYELMDKKNEELRVFRHDFPKKLRPMMLYMRQGNTDEALAIAEEFSSAVEDSRPRFCTGNYRLDTVLECEQQAAEKCGINIIFEEGGIFPAEGVAADDIYTIFPNALDNAIEGAAKCGKNCEIRIVSRISGDKVYVTVSNPSAEKPVEKNGGIVTSKSNKAFHGYGLKSIKKAAASYGSGNCDHVFENGIFTLRFNLKFR